MPHGAAVQIPDLHVGRSTNIGPLTVFPIWTDQPGPTGLVTGTAAPIQVEECQPSPVVAQLVLKNLGVKAAVLLAGELLEGGWQHRILQHSVVVGGKQSLVVSALCVEQGRWQGAAGQVRRARRASPSVIAAALSPAAYRQGEVWNRVARYNGTMGSSATGSYVDHLEHYLRSPAGIAAVKDVQHVHPLPGQRGVLIGAGGYPVVVELFPSPAALTVHLGELLVSVLLDAVASGLPNEPVTGHRARGFVELLDGLAMHDERADAGEARSFSGTAGDKAEAVGAAVGDRWAHLTVFNRRHTLLGLT